MKIYITQMGTEEEAKECNWSCSRCEHSCRSEDFCLESCSKAGSGLEHKPTGFELAKTERWCEE